MNNSHPFLLILTVFTLANGQAPKPQKTDYVTSNERKIAYRSFGNGTPIILANRFRGTLDTWDPLFIENLAKSNRVILFDYSGIGYSTGLLPTSLREVARDIGDLAVALGIKKAVVGGWSYGGLVAQVALLEYPDLVTHAVLIGTNPLGKNSLPLEERFLQHALKPLNDLDDELVLFFEPDSPQSVRLGKASHDRIHANLDVARIPSEMEIFKRYFAGGEESRENRQGWRRKFIETEKPVLILSGDHDISFPVENWFALNRSLRSSQHIIFPQCGHAPQHQFPALAAEYIARFISKTK